MDEYETKTEDTDYKEKPAKSYGYGKRPAWQWVLIYLVVAAVLYFLIYYFFFRHTGSSSTGLGY